MILAQMTQHATSVEERDATELTDEWVHLSSLAQANRTLGHHSGQGARVEVGCGVTGPRKVLRSRVGGSRGSHPFPTVPALVRHFSTVNICGKLAVATVTGEYSNSSTKDNRKTEKRKREKGEREGG